MCLKIMVVLLAGVVAWTTVNAAMPTSSEKSQTDATSLIIDNDTFIDANRILMFVTNTGSFGRDRASVFGYDYGTWYPFAGDTSAISSNVGRAGEFSPQYTAGLWLGGYVGTDLRVTVAEYSDEYVPGPMAGGTFIADNPAFRVYKLYSDSLESNPNDDYLNWPTGQGAPTDGLGKPIMVGDQMLWTVFNDADPAGHVSPAGGTLPLGIEVQQTTYAIRSSEPMGDMVLMKYKLYNRGDNNISDFYMTLWSDLDIGSASDDKVGTDTVRQLFYGYNADDYDENQYFQFPVAAGYMVLKGPIVPADGDSAYFDGRWVLGYKNLELAATASYIGGTDPDNALESYNLMRGLKMDGTPLENGTSFIYPGDPVAETGDLDPFGGDKRIMGSFGPIDFNPGDSQFVLLAFGCAQASDRLTSLTLLKSYHEVIEDYIAELEAEASFEDRDYDTFIDANKILMFVTNYGSFGRDVAEIFGYMVGTWWPYPGDTSYISQNIDDAAMHSPLFQAGLWLGGTDSATLETRVAISIYSSEYVPGPMYYYTSAPPNPLYKTYKLYSDSLAGNPNDDYLNWPSDLGAPTDEFGNPECRGRQTLWAVFNDANSAAHTVRGGRTLPLGIEIQQTTWAFANDEGEDSSLYISYKLYNKGENVIKNMYIGHWSDPDLGFAWDDLAGCDTLSDIWFCYNGDNDDGAYGLNPPALGFRILAGPVVPSPTDEAFFDGDTLSGYRNLGMTSFLKQFDDEDPYDFYQTYNLLQGIRNYDPLDTVIYQHPGDPVTQTGDLDNYPADRRMLAASGPIDFRPGDSQFVLIRMALARSTNNLTAVKAVKAVLNSGFDPYTDTMDPSTPPLPSRFTVSQNYPNPFNPSTRIEFSLPRQADVTVDIYNILGQKVKRLLDENLPAGEHFAIWDGRSDAGQSVSTGLYFYRVKAGDNAISRKMILLK